MPKAGSHKFGAAARVVVGEIRSPRDLLLPPSIPSSFPSPLPTPVAQYRSSNNPSVLFVRTQQLAEHLIEKKEGNPVFSSSRHA